MPVVDAAFTEREIAVVQDLAAGATIPEVAKKLHVSQSTVKQDAGRVCSVLGLSGRVQLATWAHKQWPSTEPTEASRPNLKSLTPRETEIMQLLAEGVSRRELGTRLHISRGTLATHCTAIFRKMGAHTIAECVSRYLQAVGPAASPSPPDTIRLVSTEPRATITVPELRSNFQAVLSQRCLEVAELAAQGLSNKQIGRRLCITIPTVKSHLLTAYKILGVHSRSGLVACMRPTARDPTLQSTYVTVNECLTPRQLEVFALIGQGHTIKGAAAELKLSVGTIKTHLQSLYTKLHVNTRAQLASIYLEYITTRPPTP